MAARHLLALIFFTAVKAINSELPLVDLGYAIYEGSFHEVILASLLYRWVSLLQLHTGKPAAVQLFQH